MALLLFLRFGFVLFLIGLNLDENGPLLPVNAAPNIQIPGPAINITIPPPKKVLLTQFNSPLLLPCTVEINNKTVKEQFSFEFHSWYRNGVKLAMGRRSEFQIYSNGSLKLPFIKKSSGSYRCVVNGTEMGYAVLLSTESIVQYAVLKRIYEQPNKTVQQGMYLVLNCPVISIPNANISWTYANYPIENRFRKKSFFQLENGTLIISNISESDTGKYKCIAHNIYSTKSHCQFTWNVSVLPPRENLSNSATETLLPPMQSNVQYVPRGGDLKLRCFGIAEKIIWYFTSKTKGIPIRINNNSNEIIIKNASIQKHQGYYNCSVNNNFQIFQVIVTEPPVIKQPMASIESALAATVTLVCNAEGNPPPQITWYRNGVKLENSYTVHYIPPLLRINSFDLKDDGIYQCFAKNIVGETVTSGLLSLRRKEDLMNLPRRPENVKCFPVNYKTLNITFESSSPLLFMNIHFATDNPYKWNSTHPVELQSNTFLIITKGLPILRPFVLYMRGLVQTSTQNMNGHQEQTFDTSLLTEGVQCATQGLNVNGIFFPNGIFIWWTILNFLTPKYYTIQFLNNDARIPTFGDTVIGTSQPINLYHTSYDVERKLHKITPLENNSTTNNFPMIDLISVNDPTSLAEVVTSLIVSGNVTGILIPNVTRVTVRALIITAENEHLKQDFRYLDWKTIENSTANDFAFKIAYSESRRVTFLWNPLHDIACIKACYASLNIEAIIRDDQEKSCQNIQVANNHFTVKKLKPLTPYKMDFLDCKTMKYLGSCEANTKSDPPGPITNQKITRRNGLKLSWDPPINSNGKIIYYVILWTFNNFTYEMNATADENSFEFPNVTENDKINITVRVMGESGVGPPIFIDLRNVQTDVLERESNYLISPTLGIALGVFLSLVCILFFAFLFIRQRRRFKMRSNQQNRSSPSDQNFPIPTTPSMELHEMQTLIPKYSNSTNFNVSIQHQQQQPAPPNLPNGNGVHFQQSSTNTLGQNNQERFESNNIDDPMVALCSSTPLVERKQDLSEILYAENEPVLLNKISKVTTPTASIAATAITTTPLVTNQLSKISSSPNFYNNPKGIIIRNEPQLQNGSIKTLLPPLKHSISPISLSEPKLLSKTDGSLKLPEGLHNEVNSLNSNASTIDNSRLKLLGTNLDSDDMNKYNSNEDESNTTSDFNNMTATTTVNMDETAESNSSLTSPIGGKTSWNYHRRPIIDPNG